MNLAQIYIEQKDFTKADNICQKGLILLPSNVKIKQYLADIKNYSASSQYEEATQLYNEKNYQEAINKYLQIQNRTPEVNMAIASCYWQMNDYKNANIYYQEVLKKNPSNMDALINSAYAYYSLNDFNNAKSMANKVLAYDKANQNAKDILEDIINNEFSSTLSQAMEKYEQSDFQNALTLINKALNQKPNEEYANYYKGLIFDELAKTNEAIKQYKSLITKNPNFAPAYYSLAVDLDNSEKYSEAISNYEKFIELKTKNNEKDDLTAFSSNRAKELKKYLEEVNGSKK